MRVRNPSRKRHPAHGWSFGPTLIAKRLFSNVRVAVLSVVLLLTLSGVIDFFPILNMRMIDLADVEANPPAKWFVENTPRDAVVLSSRYQYTPASLAGRKIFLGWLYFTDSAGYAREGSAGVILLSRPSRHQGAPSPADASRQELAVCCAAPGWHRGHGLRRGTPNDLAALVTLTWRMGAQGAPILRELYARPGQAREGNNTTEVGIFRRRSEDIWVA